MGDADPTYDFRELPKLLEHAMDGADLVMGSRLDGDIEPGAMPALHRYVGNPLLTRFLNVFYDAGVSDAHCGMRVFHRSVLDELALESNGMEFASEMVMDAAASGLEIAEEPISYRERRGEATLRRFRDGLRHVRFMLVNAPGYLFSIPGALLAVFGVALMSLGLFGVNLPVPGFRTLHFGTRATVGGSLLAIVGYQVASLGVFATVASDPIRRPNDRVTELIVDRLSLELGATAGLAVFTVGAVYATYLVTRWLGYGPQSLPNISHDIVALTAIVIGVQTVFGSFFMSAIGDRV